MMMPDHWRILDFLINKGLAHEVELHYNSNMSVTKFGKYDLWDMWSHFKHIDVGVSVDGVEGLVFSDKTIELFEQSGINNIQFFSMPIVDEFSNLEEVQMAKFRDKELKYETK